MKISDNEIKKAFEQITIPDPSESAKKRAVQSAMDEFAKKNVSAEKSSKGIPEFFRQTGKTLFKILTLRGEPVMTQRQFAAVGILVIAIGLIITIGPPVLYKPKPATELPASGSEQVQPHNDGRRPVPGKQKENGAMTKTAPPPGTTDEEKAVSIPEVAGQLTNADQTGKGIEQYRASSTEKKDSGSAASPQVVAERATGRIMLQKAYGSGDAEYLPSPGYYRDEGRDRFAEIETNSITLADEEPVSTFSIDVDTASYAYVRRQLLSGVLPQKDAVRVEELINYFTYDYPVPQDISRPFKPAVAVYPTPWNDNTKLLHIGIRGYDIVPAEKPRSNLVFLLDVSGSMNSPDKLPLLRNSFSMLVESLDPEDTVAIVVYAGAAGTVLEPTMVREKGKILAALDRLQAGGSTAGGEGIRLAYALAEMNYDKEAVNRVILATDGDFNVGITNTNELQSFIERKRDTGIFLSVLGFGQGNYNDTLMQTLAQNGNGNAAYIDSLNEARKVLVDEAAATLFTIARDVKVQVEFNPARVHDYRLIGYETRILNREDFNNDRVDAGEVGSGHSVTAIYEITPVGSREKLIDDLRYRKTDAEIEADDQGEYAFLKIRYKLPQEKASKLITRPIGKAQEYEEISAVPRDMQFAAAVAAFGQVLRNGRFTGGYDYDDILKLAEPARGRDPFGYRAEFLNLVRLAKTAKAM